MCQFNLPLVSVVIPVFNGAAFLAEAIGSVLNQTYTELECIVVDDGSTDNTAAIVKGFGNKIRYIRKANGGVASARNLGVTAANGEYLAFLDADDIWLPEKLSRQVELLRARPDLGLVYTGLYLVDENFHHIGEMTPPDGRVALRNSLLLELPVMTISMTAALPTKVFHAVCGFDERLTTSADTDFGCRVASKYPVERISEPLALYRQHGEQMHLNPYAMEHDMLIVLSKFFDGSTLEVSRWRNRAYANLNMVLAASYFKNREPQRAFSRLLRAVRYHPPRAVVLLWKRFLSGRSRLTAPPEYA